MALVVALTRQNRLELAVALMGVGVWAATSQAVTVSSKVAFTAVANVEAYVYGSSQSLKADGSALDTATDTQFAFITATNSNAKTEKTALTDYSTYTDVSDNFTFTFGSDTALTSTADLAKDTTIYTFTLTVVNNVNAENTSNDYLVVTVNSATLPDTANQTSTFTVKAKTASTVVHDTTTAAYITTAGQDVTASDVYVLSAQAEITFTYTVTLTNASADLSVAEFSPSFTLTMQGTIPTIAS